MSKKTEARPAADAAEAAEAAGRMDDAGPDAGRVPLDPDGQPDEGKSPPEGEAVALSYRERRKMTGLAMRWANPAADASKALAGMGEAAFETLFGFYRDNPDAPDEAGLIHLERSRLAPGFMVAFLEHPVGALVLKAQRAMLMGMLALEDAAAWEEKERLSRTPPRKADPDALTYRKSGGRNELSALGRAAAARKTKS